MNNIAYDYHYGQESEQYSFFKIPRVLIEDARFKKMSLASKFLYGVMLSRMELSQKSGWFDEYNRVYIYFSVDEVMEILDCGREKAVRHLAELDKDFGLIGRKRQGQGKPSKIYVKHFAREAPPPSEPPKPCNDKEKQEVGNENFQKFGNRTSKGSENIPEFLDVGKSNRQKCGNRISKSTDKELSEVPEPNPIYTYESYPDSSQPEGVIPTNQSEDGAMDAIERLQTEIKKQIEFDTLRLQYKQRELKEIVEIMTEIAMSTDGALRIGNRMLNIEFVKKRYEGLDQFHIEYVMQSMAENKNEVRNIKCYLISALFNAPATIDHFYRNQSNHLGG